jgi:hypothetical protein
MYKRLRSGLNFFYEASSHLYYINIYLLLILSKSIYVFFDETPNNLSLTSSTLGIASLIRSQISKLAIIF